MVHTISIQNSGDAVDAIDHVALLALGVIFTKPIDVTPDTAVDKGHLRRRNPHNRPIFVVKLLQILMIDPPDAGEIMRNAADSLQTGSRYRLQR